MFSTELGRSDPARRPLRASRQVAAKERRAGRRDQPALNAAEIERFWGAKSGTPEGDRLDVLATLVDAYESEHDPIDPPDPIEAIKFRMDQQGLTRSDLEAILGARARAAEVLNRERDCRSG